MKASIAQAEGDLPRAAELLASPQSNADDSRTLSVRIYQAILERNPGQIIPRVKEELAKPDPASDWHAGERRFFLGWLQELAGDHAAARATWREARIELDSFLKEQPENWQLICTLALTNMGLGDKAAAFGLLDQAAAAMPIKRDALDGPVAIETLAQVAARMEEPDRAIAALRRVISLPSRTLPLYTRALLRLDPRSIRCAAIRDFKNSARRSSRELAQFFGEMCALIFGLPKPKNFNIQKSQPNQNLNKAIHK